MKIRRQDPFTGRYNIMDIDLTVEQFRRVEEGVECMQVIAPDLTPDEREFLMTGITAESWERTFPKEEEAREGDEEK